MRIQRLNMDNSWYLGMNGLTLLIDPWLEGEEVDFFRWFNTQWHRTPPMDYEEIPPYDLVLITQKYPDHFHAQTLLKLQPARILAPASIEKALRRLLPDSEIISLGINQQKTVIHGVSITWHGSGNPMGPVYDAFSISDGSETVFVAPHGFNAGKSGNLPEKPVKLLISTFNDFRLPFFLGGTIAPGLKGLSQLVEKLSPARIVATHDEDKHAKGLVMKLAKVTRISAAELEALPTFKGRTLEINHYEMLEL